MVGLEAVLEAEDALASTARDRRDIALRATGLGARRVLARARRAVAVNVRRHCGVEARARRGGDGARANGACRDVGGLRSRGAGVRSVGVVGRAEEGGAVRALERQVVEGRAGGESAARAEAVEIHFFESGWKGREERRLRAIKENKDGEESRSW